MGAKSIKYRFLCVAIFVAAPAFSTPSAAQTVAQLQVCMSLARDPGAYTPDAIIKACSVFIETRRSIGGRAPIPKNALWGVFGLRGLAYMMKSDYDAALADFDQQISLKQDDSDQYTNRGNAYAFKRDYVRALADYDHALRLKPGSELAIKAKASALLYQRLYGQWEQYLKGIEDEREYANWSGPPLEIYRREK